MTSLMPGNTFTVADDISGPTGKVVFVETRLVERLTSSKCKHRTDENGSRVSRLGVLHAFYGGTILSTLIERPSPPRSIIKRELSQCTPPP